MLLQDNFRFVCAAPGRECSVLIGEVANKKTDVGAISLSNQPHELAQAGPALSLLF